MTSLRYTILRDHYSSKRFGNVSIISIRSFLNLAKARSARWCWPSAWPPTSRSRSSSFLTLLKVSTAVSKSFVKFRLWSYSMKAALNIGLCQLYTIWSSPQKSIFKVFIPRKVLRSLNSSCSLWWSIPNQIWWSFWVANLRGPWPDLIWKLSFTIWHAHLSSSIQATSFIETSSLQISWSTTSAKSSFVILESPGLCQKVWCVRVVETLKD